MRSACYGLAANHGESDATWRVGRGSCAQFAWGLGVVQQASGSQSSFVFHYLVVYK